MPMPWNEIWQVTLAIAAGIVSLTAAGSAVARLFNPYKKIVKRVEECEDVLKRHSDLFRKDLERFERNEETDTLVLEALFTLVEHARTNNSTGLMEATSKKMQAFLINKK